jgi:hypothetical protein
MLAAVIEPDRYSGHDQTSIYRSCPRRALKED